MQNANESPLAPDADGSVILAALTAAGGAPVSAAGLAQALAAHGRGGDPAMLWTAIEALNGVLAAGAQLAYVAHFPERGFALVVQTGGGHVQAMQRLPARSASVIGCDEAVGRLKALLAQHRCVSIVAAGGMGKTTLATVLAEAVLPGFRDGVCFVDLAPMADPALLVRVLASALGVGAASIAGLAAFLRDKHMLLVLDSCEHIIGAAAGLAEQLLRAASGVRVLATSREPLRASGEWVYRHGPMGLPAIPDSASVAQALAFPAVRLFVERAADGGFILDEANLAQVCAICRRLDGIPLAIELAAARVALLGIAELALQLEERPLASAGGRRSSVARHRTLRAMLDWSFDLLPEAEQAAFAKLALYRGEFTLAAATALLAETPDGAADATACVLELIAKSLVVRRDANGECRLRLLDTTRAYAGDKLDARNLRAALHLRHIHFLCELLDASEHDWLQMNRWQWLERYAIWIDDIRTALDWAFSPSGDTRAGILLAAASFSLGHQASLTTEFGERIERALRELSHVGPHEPLLATRLNALMCNVHQCHTDYARMQGTLTYAWVAEQGSALYQYGTALATGCWGAAFGQGAFTRALEHAEAIGAQARTGADLMMDLVSQRMIAQSLHFLGQHRAAQRLASNVLLNAWRKIPLIFNPSPVDVQVSMRIVQARISWMEGKPDQALAIAAECLTHAEADTAIAQAQALALCNVPLALWCGDVDGAAALVERLVLHAERYSLEFWYQWSFRYRDVLAAQHGDAAAALRLAACATSVFEHMQRDHLVTFDPRWLAEDSVARVESGQVAWCAPELLRAQGVRLAQAGQLQAAEAALQRAIALARVQNTLGWELRGVTSLARLWQTQTQGHGAAARLLLAGVLTRLGEGEGSADQRQARALLAEL